MQASQHATGAHRGGDDADASRINQEIGKSGGGLTTKIVAIADRTGRIPYYRLKPGNVAEVSVLPELLDGLNTEQVAVLLADRAYDSTPIRNLLGSPDIIGTIPSRSNRRNPPDYDGHTYQGRHLIENGFADIKQFRWIATRYAKLAAGYAAVLDLVSWLLATRPSRRKSSPHGWFADRPVVMPPPITPEKVSFYA